MSSDARGRANVEHGSAVDASIDARPSMHGGRRGEEPVWARSACGAYVEATSGRRYLDLVLGYGAVLLGHADPFVTDAVIRAIRCGVSPTLRSIAQVELAERLAAVLPNVDSCVLLKTGSEATSAAVRLARAHTGRDMVLHWGYHGWHDWCAPRRAGVPASYRALTLRVPVDDVVGLRRVFAEHGDRTAALVLQPGDTEPVTAAFVRACRELADHHGVLLVLDEIRTGFRLGLGGAQAEYGVRADLVTVGKALGNGHPIAAVAGRRAVMERTRDVSMSSLFARSTDGIAAATAVLDVLTGTDALDVVRTRGTALQQALRAAADRHGLPVRVTGFPQMPFHRFLLPREREAVALNAFHTGVLSSGVLVHRDHHWFSCREMTPADVATAAAAFDVGYAAAADALGRHRDEE